MNLEEKIEEMVSLQIISKILSTKDVSILENNLLTTDYFVGYEPEIEYILDHVKKYKTVPDKATFLSKFPEIELVEVAESDRYLVDTIREEYLYYKSVPVVQKVAQLLKTDANAAAEYMVQALRDLQPTYDFGGVDIISGAQERFEKFVDRKQHQDDWFFTCGFPELDELVHGIQREEELFVIFARTNQGKSWVLEKMCTHVWQLGFNVGYISPEMGAVSVGYRFDTLYQNISNKGLMWGRSEVKDEEYKEYIDALKQRQNRFLVATPSDFNRQITITRLKNWIKQYELQLVAIDGITYMTDERYRRGDNKTTTLTNLSEDLMLLSMEMRVPILIVVQANRGAVPQDDTAGTPELENIRDSDGIAQNASKVISIRQTKDGVLKLEVKKQRFGAVGGKLNYQWDIDRGDFTFIPSYDDAEPVERTERRVREVKKQYRDKEDVF